MRVDGRNPDQLRPIKVQKAYLRNAAGSVLIEAGNTRLICAASISDKVPDWLKGKGKGWVTAEYAMLPASTSDRRDGTRTKRDSRSLEIQRLIGRCLRAVIDLKALGERTVWLDCDVIDADGGTRTAAVTGAYIALYEALDKIVKSGEIPAVPLTDSIAAISVGIVDGEAMLDLNYQEDSTAQVDMNIAMTGSGKFVEIQGTAEHTPFDGEMLDKMLDLARKGMKELFELQRKCLSI